MNDDHSKTGDPAVGSTRLVRLWREDFHDGDLKTACLRVGRVRIGIGWVVRYSGMEKPFACNRNVNWRYDRKICLSALRLRIGLHIMPNAAGEPQPRKPRT